MMRVLFIDDNADLRALMTLLLGRQGYSVRVADGAESALALCPSWQPQLIVSDIGMPGRDGYELIELLRKDCNLAPFRALALTGFSLTADKRRAQRAGFDECLIKPVNFEQLFAVLKTLGATLSTDGDSNDFIARENTEMTGTADLDSDLDRPRFSSR